MRGIREAPGGIVRLVHVRLVHEQDFLGNVLNLLEQRLQCGKIVGLPRFGEIASACVTSGIALMYLSNKTLIRSAFSRSPGSVILLKFHIQCGSKLGGVFLNQTISFHFVAGESKQDAAVHSLQGFLHVLTGHHAAVIFLEYHIDGLAEVIDLRPWSARR